MIRKIVRKTGVTHQIAKMLKHVSLRIKSKVGRSHVVEPFNLALRIQQDHAVRRCLKRSQKVLQPALTVPDQLVSGTNQTPGPVRHFAPQTRAHGNVGCITNAQPMQQARAPGHIHQEPSQPAHHNARQCALRRDMG